MCVLCVKQESNQFQKLFSLISIREICSLNCFLKLWSWNLTSASRSFNSNLKFPRNLKLDSSYPGYQLMRLLRVELCRVDLYHSKQRNGVQFFPTTILQLKQTSILVYYYYFASVNLNLLHVGVGENANTSELKSSPFAENCNFCRRKVIHLENMQRHLCRWIWCYILVNCFRFSKTIDTLESETNGDKDRERSSECCLSQWNKYATNSKRLRSALENFLLKKSVFFFFK